MVSFHGTILHESLAGLLGDDACLHTQFLHRLGQNLLIRFKAHVGNETALFRAQQVAGAADIQILHRDIEAAAQVGEFLDGLQATARVLRNRDERRNHQITESLPVGPAYATPQLVQVGQADVLCLIDDVSMMVVHRSMS